MRPIIYFIALATFVSAEARDVIREGIAITVPEGKWKQGVGNCTGDWAWTRDGIGFAIGTRHYLKNDPEYLTSGQIRIHNFTDIQSEVVSLLEPQGHLIRVDKRKSKGGSEILVLEFDVDPDKENPSRSRTLYAYREALDRRSAVEVGCSFIEKQKVLGMQIFEAALKSLCEVENQTK